MSFIKKHVKLILVLTAFLMASSWYLLKRENNYFTHLNRITNRFIREMEQEHGLSCFSIGGSLAGNVKEVSIKFNCYEKKSIEEARILEVNCIERFCEMINSHKKIRPHLEKFPFGYERVGIMICFCEEGFKYFPPKESITTINNAKGTFIYKISFNDHRPNQIILREPYNEAYEKVQGSSM